jgi:RNA polymerase sigma-70 factor (ECF subfamily)
MDWRQALAENDRWLRTIVFARLRDWEAADEVMQEVALAAVRTAAPPRDPGKAAPWLYRVALRQVLLYRRKCGRRRRLEAGYAARRQENHDEQVAPDPLAWLLADERRRLVREALESLAPRDSEILLLKYTENWSYRQLSEHLGLSPSAVEARLFRARQRLREALGAREAADVAGGLNK